MAASGKALARLRAETLRDKDRASLAALRARLETARTRRKVAMKRATKRCQVARVAVRARVEAFRLQERARVKAEVAAMRGRARNSCQARKYRIGQAGGRVLSKERAKLAEERRYQAQLKGFAAVAKKRHAKVKATAKEQRSESDDYVRGNIPRELVPVFDRVRGVIKGGPRTTRTEAFLQWAEEHPSDVLAYQEHDTDRAVAELVAEHERVAGRLRKGKAHYTKLARSADEVPF